MADEKNDKPVVDPFTEIVGGIIVLLFAIYALNGIFSYINRAHIFSQGSKIFTPEGVLALHTRPISSLANPIGASIVNLADTDVFNYPTGYKVGTQEKTARGKIIQGPVEENGDVFWYIDYTKNNPDGWVKEKNIAYLASEPTFFERILIRIFSWVKYVKLIIILFSLSCIAGIAYLIKNLTKLRINERKLLYPERPEVVSSVNPQWERVLDHSESQNENDWRLAIIEADIMLGNMLDKMFLPGETIGEKLKAVEKSDFTTIDFAWEAHKTRNSIAHEGANFRLSQHEARRVIEMYKKVFEEFKII